MNILFLSALVPFPPEDGDRQRSFHLLRVLASRHQVHLLCFYRTWAEYRQLEALQAFCASVEGIPISRWAIYANSLRAWFTTQPLNVAAFKSAAMQKAVARAVHQHAIEAVHVYRLRMAPYALAVPQVKKVLDYTDALTRYFQAREQQPAPWWKKIYLKREARCLAEYEVEISHSFDACVVSSTCDQAVLQKAGAGNNFTVVTNGVDTQVFRPALKLPKTLNVLFVGNMQYPPNAEGIQNFCRHVWPRVRARIPGAHFWVVGNPPVGTVAAWSRTFPEAEFLGRVPEVQPYYSRSRVAVCPLEVASGRQFKVIEAFAAGVPVVTTNVVAKNLAAVAGKDLLVGNHPQALADAIVSLLQNDRLAKELRSRARERALKEFDWAIAGKALLGVYGRR